MSNAELDNLIGAFLAGELDDAAREEFAARLESDPAALRAFDEALRIESLLLAAHATPAQRADERRAAEKLAQNLTKLQSQKAVQNRARMSPRLVKRPVKTSSAVPFRAWTALAAAVAIMFGMAFYFIYGTTPGTVKTTAGNARQQFTVASGHVWVDGHDVREVGDNDWLNVSTDGAAMLTAKDGTTVTLEAGASAVMRARGASLLSGAASFGVKPGADLFVLETPAGSVNSAGGEFNVSLRPASSESDTPNARHMELALAVSVARGTAQVDFDGATTRLTEGESREFSSVSGKNGATDSAQHARNDLPPDLNRPDPPGPGLLRQPPELAVIDAIFRCEKDLGLTNEQKATLSNSRKRIADHFASMGSDSELRDLLVKQRDAHMAGDDPACRRIHERIKHRTDELLNTGNLPGDPLEVLTPRQEQLMRDDLEMLRPPPRRPPPPGRDPRDHDGPPPPRPPPPPPPRNRPDQ